MYQVLGVYYASVVFRLQSIELANENLRSESEKCKSALEVVRSEKTSLEQRVSDLDTGARSFKDEIRLLEAELRKLKQKERDNEEVSIHVHVYNIFLKDPLLRFIYVYNIYTYWVYKREMWQHWILYMFIIWCETIKLIECPLISMCVLNALSLLIIDVVTNHYNNKYVLMCVIHY